MNTKTYTDQHNDVNGSSLLQVGEVICEDGDHTIVENVTRSKLLDGKDKQVIRQSQIETDIHDRKDDTHALFDSRSYDLPTGFQHKQNYNSRTHEEYFILEQKWQGLVIDVNDETFTARLSPVIGERTQLHAEVYLDEVDLADRSLIKPGSIFYWSIGYSQRTSGRRRTSIIRFRRLPPWTKRDLINAKKQAEEAMSLFNDPE